MKKFFSLIIFLFLFSCSAKISDNYSGNYIYWGYSNDSLHISSYKTDVAVNYYEFPTNISHEYWGDYEPPWHHDDNMYKCKYVYIDCKNNKIKPKSMCRWFSCFFSCEYIYGLDNIDTSNIISMSYLFERCYQLKKLDLSKFNTTNVIYMQYMFDTCTNLEYLDISNFDTSSVIYIQFMFGNPSNYIKNISINHFDLSQVNDISDKSEIFCDHVE